MSELETVTGTVFDLQRFSLHDGPGIRTTVFIKGCNLRCAWCHNPESFLKRPQIRVDLNKCIFCGKCASVCPEDVHRIEEDGVHIINTEACKLCIICVDVCPVDAISIIGKEYTPQEVIDVVKRDEKYYKRSKGGITFSGGEATFQYEFLLQLLQLSRAEDLHVCLETNGMMPEAYLRQISHYVDLFLFDFKHSDDMLHQKYTRVPNQPILNNLDLLNQLEKPVVLRCPIIPGINDTLLHFESIKLLKRKYGNIQGVELMPYHEIGISKWANLGYIYSLADIKPPNQEQIESWNREVNLL